MSDQDREYMVFARIDQGDDLKHIGSVNASNDKLARSFAQSVYDEEEWARMLVVDQDDAVEVPMDGTNRRPTLLGDAL